VRLESACNIFFKLGALVDEFSYMFMGTEVNAPSLQPGRYCEGPSLDGQGEFHFEAKFQPLGEEPVLGPARPDSGAQREQMDSRAESANTRRTCRVSDYVRDTMGCASNMYGEVHSASDIVCKASTKQAALKKLYSIVYGDVSRFP
jgi:hypothetical protein